MINAVNGPAIGVLLGVVLGYFYWKYQWRPLRVKVKHVDAATENFLAALADDTQDDVRLVNAKRVFRPTGHVVGSQRIWVRKRIRE